MPRKKQALPFSCPKCMCELLTDGHTAVCPLGHSYDKSKYGYYNLLISNTGGVHGDNREMILARRAFLSAGYYAPLSEKISSLAAEHTARGGLLVDVGCGEGYYTDAIEKTLSEHDNLTRYTAYGTKMDENEPSFRVAAFDISKDAVREAARRNSRIFYAVASAYRTPIADGAASTVTNAFSPFAREELLRILAEDGVFIMAIPEREHLFELKEILYKTPYKNEVKDSFIEGFSLVYDERLTYKMKLSSRDEVSSLFKMTPYAYRTPREASERILSLDALECTADFHIFVYRKES